MRDVSKHLLSHGPSVNLLIHQRGLTRVTLERLRHGTERVRGSPGARCAPPSSSPGAGGGGDVTAPRPRWQPPAPRDHGGLTLHDTGAKAGDSLWPPTRASKQLTDIPAAPEDAVPSALLYVRVS